MVNSLALAGLPTGKEVPVTIKAGPHRIGGWMSPQNQSGHYGEEKKISCPFQK